MAKSQIRMTTQVVHILLSLSEEPGHAYGLGQRIRETTGGRVQIGPGSLHFTLGRLLDSGLIQETDQPDDSDDSRRRYFALTPAGRTALAQETAGLAEIVDLARARGVLG